MSDKLQGADHDCKESAEESSIESFKVIRKIGQGGYGRAFLVESLDEKKSLRVVKQVNLLRMNQFEKEKAIQEIKTMSQLKHFNIIRYRSHIVQNNILSILMDYADGGDINTLIKERLCLTENNKDTIKQSNKNEKFIKKCNQITIKTKKFWSEDVIIDYFVQMCLAIKYLHDRKIIHRDIKPSNFFICKNGLIKLGDFGLSSLLPKTHYLLSTKIGSPIYLAPEMCKGEHYNQKIDIWALGCVLYEMCSLQRAFSGHDIRDVMNNICTLKPPQIPKFYDQDLQNLVKQMLSKDPNQRPNINEILEIPLIKYKAISLLGRSQGRIELAHSIFHGQQPGITPTDFPKEILFVDEYIELKDELTNHIKMEKGNQTPNKQNEEESNAMIDSDENNTILDLYLNQNSEHEVVEFMGYPIKLPHSRKTDHPIKKADDIRDLIIEMIGMPRFIELYKELSIEPSKNTKITDIIISKYPKKKDVYIAKLVHKLIQYETDAEAEIMKKKLLAK